MRAKGADLLVNEALNVGVLYLDADMPLKFFVSVVRWEIHRATQLSLEGLVVVVPEVTGFPPPDFISRKEMVTEWAQAAREEMIERMALDAFSARIRLAIVVSDDYIDRERIGVKIAAANGLTACIVTTEQEAIDWMVATGRTAPSL